MNVKYLVENYITPQHSTEFCRWAFGEQFEYLYGAQSFADAWNERHGTKFKLGECGNVLDDFKEMTRIWHEERENNVPDLKFKDVCDEISNRCEILENRVEEMEKKYAGMAKIFIFFKDVLSEVNAGK